MAVLNLFSRRKKLAQGEAPDVYRYDVVPEKLRVQIVHILRDSLGNKDQYDGYGMAVYGCYEFIVEALCRELGKFQLTDSRLQHRDFFSELHQFILTESDTDNVLDAIELSFQAVDRLTREYSHANKHNADAVADAALEELNTRFQQASVGYRFESGSLIRIDSELLHSEVVKPALALLRGSFYAGAEAEFLKAHEHYRHNRPKEALAECLKALESTMKAIAAKRKWTIDPKATANPLIALMYEKGLIPAFWSTHFAGLRSTLESGIPTARNRLGGHGQGADVTSVPGHLVAYVIHQTAAAIVFLVNAEKAL